MLGSKLEHDRQLVLNERRSHGSVGDVRRRRMTTTGPSLQTVWPWIIEHRSSRASPVCKLFAGLSPIEVGSGGQLDSDGRRLANDDKLGGFLVGTAKHMPGSAASPMGSVVAIAYAIQVANSERLSAESCAAS